jgi:hypothetical protein
MDTSATLTTVDTWLLASLVAAVVIAAAACSSPAPTPIVSPAGPIATSSAPAETPPGPPASRAPSRTAAIQTTLPLPSALPTQADVFGAIARWMPTYFDEYDLPRRLYVLTGASEYQTGFNRRGPAMLTTESREILPDAFGPSHGVVFVDDPNPLLPSPYPGVAVSWSWGDGGAVVGFSMDDNALSSDHPSVVVSVDNGSSGTDVLVTVGWDGSTWQVVTVGQPAQWIS